MNSAKVFAHDARDPKVLSHILLNGETVAEYFARTGDTAFTQYQYVNDRRRTRIRADIYFHADFFALSGEQQGLLFFHEMLHTALQVDENGLGQEFGMPHGSIDDWIAKGCP